VYAACPGLSNVSVVQSALRGRIRGKGKGTPQKKREIHYVLIAAMKTTAMPKCSSAAAAACVADAGNVELPEIRAPTVQAAHRSRCGIPSLYGYNRQVWHCAAPSQSVEMGFVKRLRQCAYGTSTKDSAQGCDSLKASRAVLA